MMNLFGTPSGSQELTICEYLDQSAFDEKFEVDLSADRIRNIHHVDNKYYVPVQAGCFSDMCDYADQHMVHPDDHAFYAAMNPGTLLQRMQQSDPSGMMRVECRQRLVDGTYRWVQYLGITGTDKGVPEGLIYFYVYDIQNQKDRLNGHSSTGFSITNRSELTGLLNSNAFIPAANNLLQSSNEGPWCCVAIDIQHSTVFRSWYSQEKGDYVLARIGAVLQDYEANENAVAAYFGHDYFGLFTLYDDTKLQRLYNSVREIVYSYSNITGFLPAFGVNVLGNPKQLSLDIYDMARMAAEEAKKSYTNRICCCNPQAYQMKKDEYTLLREFYHAIHHQELTFYLQPQCTIDNGSIVGAEALARWIKPDGSTISPALFIPVLEKNGLISELDKHIWDAVCRWLRSLLDQDLAPVPVSINISQADLLSMDVASYLYGLCERYNVPPRLLKAEITESTYAENFDHISQVVTRLQEKGFSVYMDDFGAGYSSLNMLDQINVDVLKLDIAFMRKEGGLSTRAISIVESIFGMTRSLDIPVIVEGVENENQLHFLNDLGCLYAQGYYFYKPMSTADYEQLLHCREKLTHEGLHCRTTELFLIREFLNENLFTNTVLNNILGPVAFYLLDGMDLTISRYNKPFYQAIADAAMDDRRVAIQNYVVREDRPALYRALDEACSQIASGGSCEIRFYKSDGSIFWFRMRFFFLRMEKEKKLFYGQIEDLTESRAQSMRLLEILRQQSDVALTLNLDQRIVQYVTGENTLYQPNLPSMSMGISIARTAQNRIPDDDARQAFVDFFDVDRMISAYHRAIYHEVLTIPFRMKDKVVPTEFSTYCIRHSKDDAMIVYAFAKVKETPV